MVLNLALHHLVYNLHGPYCQRQLHCRAIEARILVLLERELFSFLFFIMFRMQISRSIVSCVCRYHTSALVIVIWGVPVIYAAFPAFSLVPPVDHSLYLDDLSEL